MEGKDEHIVPDASVSGVISLAKYKDALLRKFGDADVELIFTATFSTNTKTGELIPSESGIVFHNNRHDL